MSKRHYFLTKEFQYGTDHDEILNSGDFRPKVFPDVNVYEHVIQKTASRSASVKKKKLKEFEDEREVPLSFFALFRYANGLDVFLMVVGFVFSVINGASMPVLALMFGDMTNMLIIKVKQGSSNTTKHSWDVYNEGIARTTITNFTDETNARYITDVPLSQADFKEDMAEFSSHYLFLACLVLVAAFFQTLCWELACERQVHRLRQVFFSQTLRQDVSWFDKYQDGDLTSKLSDDLERVREGIGSKVSMFTQQMATFISGLIVGTIANWKLSLLILIISPFLIGTTYYMAGAMLKTSAREQLKYGAAGAIASETLGYIRTVAAFGGQRKQITKFEAALEEGYRISTKKYYFLAMVCSSIYVIMYVAYGAVFWYGSYLILNGVATPGNVFTVFFSIMAGAFSFGNALPYLTYIGTAMGSASNIFEIIDRIPPIDPCDELKEKPDKMEGHIQFKGVYFSYPSRPLVTVLRDLNLDIEAGKTVALVGASGGGKSTVVSLLLRFYDADRGKVLIDGRPVNSLNLGWLRSQIGVVTQEPVLFGVSIAENISYGKLGITQQEIVNAAAQANAHSFILDLPQGYETLVGERGTKLSGGQKQRIAIARALVRNPKILLLDEATSALDAHSEFVVQEALDKAMAGRTTIIIAHRLATVKNAKTIYALKEGQVFESGTHESLMLKEGLYYNLVMSQKKGQKENGYEDRSSDCEKFDTKEDVSEMESIILKKSSCVSLSSRKYSLADQKAAEDIPDDEELAEVSIFRLISVLGSSLVFIFVIIGFIVFGSVVPAFAFIFGEIFHTFTMAEADFKKAITLCTIMFLVLAVVAGSSFYTMMMTSVIISERLALNLRVAVFTNLLNQAVGFFDNDKNSAGRLINSLARDPPLFKTAAGARGAMFCSAMVTVVVGISLAGFYGFKLALLLSIVIPVLFVISYKQQCLLRVNQQRDAWFMDNAGQIASEGVKNFKTVQYLGSEKHFVKMYTELLAVPFKEAKKQAYIFAVVYSVSQAVNYVLYGAAFRYGGYLIEIGEMEPTNVYRVFFAMAFCAGSIAAASNFMLDYGRAKIALSYLYHLMFLKSEIEGLSTSGETPDIDGKVTFENIHFSYPTRKDVQVLRGLSLSIEPGMTLALVGPSGCGKSTVISLLMRFYDPSGGRVLIDKWDIRDINVMHLRSAMGLVTQEPVLFDCSIWENIAYGANASSDQLVAMADVIKAAKTANIHDFILKLPQGYETQVGKGGTQLSGGQKQRIAIARAVIRDPKILLLDEATSALDTENEKVVHEALEQARKGRTSIVIAHRLSTVQNADRIAVIQQGHVAEYGSHEELMKKQGLYYALIKRQTV